VKPEEKEEDQNEEATFEMQSKKKVNKKNTRGQAKRIQ